MSSPATTSQFTSKKSFIISCLLAPVSCAVVYITLKSLHRSDITKLYTQIPLYAAIGLAVGVVYLFAMRKLLASSRVQDELPRGLMWFNYSTLAVWSLLLPIENEYSNFCTGLLLSAGCSRLLGAIYTVFGASLSNRKRFAGNFVMLAVTTMLVISVVKSSLALSLGLVGALSIVRFRTAVKEPEELAFLFLTIALGLGFGASRFDYTLAGFWAVSLGYILFRRVIPSQVLDNAYLLSFWGSPTLNVKAFENFMETQLGEYELTRLEQTADTLHISIIAELPSTALCAAFSADCKQEFPDLNMNIVQTRGLS